MWAVIADSSLREGGVMVWPSWPVDGGDSLKLTLVRRSEIDWKVIAAMRGLWEG